MPAFKPRIWEIDVDAIDSRGAEQLAQVQLRLTEHGAHRSPRRACVGVDEMDEVLANF